MKNLALGCAFNTHDIFYNFPYKKLKLNCNKCKEITNDYHRQPLVYKIFRESMKLIFKDILENNNTFELPTGAKKCDIHVDRLEGDLFKKCRQKGAYQDIDIIASNFSGYKLSFFMYSNNRTRKKPIYLNKEFQKILTDNVNKGMSYC